jgi:hydroxymethylglutaryl-CoA lyase
MGELGGCPFAAGATGNICTEDLLYLLAESGYETGVDLEKAIAIALKAEAVLGRRLTGQVMRSGPRLRLHAPDAVATAAG